MSNILILTNLSRFDKGEKNIGYDRDLVCLCEARFNM